MKVYHYTDRANLDSIMHNGLKTTSRYESFTELRKDVVFCWLSPSDNKIFSDDTICLEITVDENNCIVASMDYISFAMMYKYGGEKYGGMNIPINERAAELFVKLYEITAIQLSQYKDGNLFSPEVLVKGTITPENIRIYVDK
ncbi:MAG: hypothetical protein IJA41_01990 [Clostridia bacterium]|nr:hypothetical protein [Clostridia bacterium]